MLAVNEYFDGKVKSISFDNEQGTQSSGVMAAGDYQFATRQPEHMQVISGALWVTLPGEQEARCYQAGMSFDVDADQTFQVSVREPSAYLCFYR